LVLIPQIINFKKKKKKILMSAFANVLGKKDENTSEDQPMCCHFFKIDYGMRILLLLNVVYVGALGATGFSSIVRGDWLGVCNIISALPSLYITFRAV